MLSAQIVLSEVWEKWILSKAGASSTSSSSPEEGRRWVGAFRLLFREPQAKSNTLTFSLILHTASQLDCLKQPLWSFSHLAFPFLFLFLSNGPCENSSVTTDRRSCGRNLRNHESGQTHKAAIYCNNLSVFLQNMKSMNNFEYFVGKATFNAEVSLLKQRGWRCRQ